ncbi:MAG: hypothetical protein R2847_08735 [Bacteroidia bacterium]
MSQKKYTSSAIFTLGVPSYDESLVGGEEKYAVGWMKLFHDQNYLFWAMCLISGLNTGHVVPKGYVRLLGKLAEFTDYGIPVTIFAGQRYYVDVRLPAAGNRC